MTEKRFTETVSTGIVTDNQTGKEYKCDMRIDDDLLEVLNELHEEKEYWKERYKQELEKNSIMTIAYDKQGNAHILPKRVD